jgi:hypothetical protein
VTLLRFAAVQLGRKPAALAVMALAITTVILAMLTLHQALSVTVNSSGARAGLPLQQEQQQQLLLQQGSGRLVDVVPHRLLLATHNVSKALGLGCSLQFAVAAPKQQLMCMLRAALYMQLGRLPWVCRRSVIDSIPTDAAGRHPCMSPLTAEMEPHCHLSCREA